jgi:5-methylcytosine-specific restriction endonuclease McrBC regulatory subunit McrC
LGHSILIGNADTRANVSKIEYATPSYRRNDLQKVIKANVKLVNHPYFTKYRELQKLCLQILRREKINIGGKEKDKIHGLLFDGAWLWEKYVGKVIENTFWHPCNKSQAGGHYLFSNVSDNSKHTGLIYPKESTETGVSEDKYQLRNNAPSQNIVRNKDIFLTKLGFKIPTSRSNWKIFVNEMNESEKKLHSCLK